MLALKLDVPYTPVTLDAVHRRRLAKSLRDPNFAAQVTRQADALTRDLVRAALGRDRGQRRQDSKGGTARPQPARPPVQHQSKG